MDMGDVPSKRELAAARAERKIVYKKKPGRRIARPSTGFLSNKFEGNPGVWTEPTAKDKRRSYKA
jgi:hypothetical protein